MWVKLAYQCFAIVSFSKTGMPTSYFIEELKKGTLLISLHFF